MIPVYKVKWPERDEPSEKVAKPVISWSRSNWIAFATGPSWQQHQRQHQQQQQQQQSSKLSIDTVFVLDPNHPSEVFPVFTHHSGIIEHIEWNNNRTSFLTIDSFGIGKIWVPDNNLMNQWKSPSTIDLGDGDSIRKAFWISSCRKYAFNIEKMYSGKEILERFVPLAGNSLSSTCSDQKDGLAVITAGGVFKVLMLEDFSVTNVYQKNLGSLKINVIKADVSINDNGKIFIALLTNRNTVELFSVNFKPNDDAFDLIVEVWPCFVPSTGTQDVNFNSFEVAHLICVSVNNVDQIIVCSKGPTMSVVQIYEVKKEEVVLHPKFPSTPPSNNPPFVDTCICLLTFTFEHDIVSMFVTNVRFSNTTKAGNNLGVGPKLTLVDAYGTFTVYSLLNHSQISKSTIACIQNDCIRAGVFSPCDFALFAVTDRGNAYMFLTPQYSTGTDQSKIKNIVNFLHYSLIESCVPFDLFTFLSTQETIIEQCYKVLIEDYNKFNIVYQNLFFNFFLNMKAMFYHLFKDYCGVIEMYYAMLLHNIFFYITSFFQSEKDANFMDMVLKLCMSSKEVEISKIVQTIDSKEINMFLCNDSQHRPLIQWVTDYAVHIVRLILSSNHLGQNWKLCLKYFDQASILYLRQLLLIFYIMYQKSPNNHQFYPIFVTMTTPMDITTQLFKLVSKLQQILLGELIDVTMNDLPFSNLPLMYLEMPTHDPSVCVLSQLSISTTKQEYDEYEFQLKQKWEDIHRIGFSSPLSVGVAPISTKLRQIFDGINLTPASLMQGELVKQCSRCNCLSVYVGHATRTFNTTWKGCWEEHCYCGGLWKKVSWRS